MNIVEKIFQPILFVLRNHKKTILLSLISAVIFFVLIFPYDDLSDFITEQISKATQNQVFVQFDKLRVGFLPPSIKMKNVTVDTAFSPASFRMGGLRLAPSIAGLLAFKPGFSASIDDMLGGDLNLTVKAGKEINDTTRMQSVDLSASEIDLAEVTKMAGLPIPLEGKLDIATDGNLEPNFGEQPEAEVSLNVEDLKVRAATIPTMMGPLSIQGVNFKKITGAGRLSNSELMIEQAKLGEANDAIQGKIKGRIALRFIRDGNRVVPQWGAYELNIDLTLDRKSEKDFGVFLSFYDKFKTVTGSGSRYLFKLSAPGFNTPPNATPAMAF